jgi:hypothetical protein
MTARLTPEQLAEIEALVGTQTITGGDAARALLAHIRAVEAERETLAHALLTAQAEAVAAKGQLARQLEVNMSQGRGPAALAHAVDAGRAAALEEAATLVATLCGNEIARRVRALRRARRAG